MAMTGYIKVHCRALAAFATLGFGGMLQTALAADPASASTPTEWHHGADAYERGPEGGMFHALHRLNLSDAQKQQVRDITSQARTQWRSQAGTDASDVVALGNPGDPNHATALAAAKVRAAQRIQDWSDVQQQVYAVLSSDQQAQLPQVLAEMQSRHSAKHGVPPPTAQGAGTGS
jgi:Spy/CpxP family protein refolding chaperone